MKLINLATLVLLVVSTTSMAEKLHTRAITYLSEKPESNSRLVVTDSLGREKTRPMTLQQPVPSIHSSRALQTASHDLPAVSRYMRAAQQGNALAQYRLGQLFLDGEMIEQDHRKALMWFTASAEQGLVQAQLLLSSMYLKGIGTSRDALMARKWFDKAMASSERVEMKPDFNMHNTMVF